MLKKSYLFGMRTKYINQNKYDKIHMHKINMKKYIFFVILSIILYISGNK